MFRYLISLLFSVLLFISPALAHSPAETHAVLQIKQGQAQLKIELPWTISEAIQEAYPKEKDQVVFWTLLGRYMGEHVQLSRDGVLIPASDMYQLPGDHSHSATLVLNYPTEDLRGIEVRNTVLFNLHQKQKNHLRVPLGSNEILVYKTVPGDESILIGEGAKGGTNFWWYLLIVPLLIIWLIRRIRK